jgi:formylglycine-generating enzyme required for sulfatase activity
MRFVRFTLANARAITFEGEREISGLAELWASADGPGQWLALVTHFRDDVTTALARLYSACRVAWPTTRPFLSVHWVTDTADLPDEDALEGRAGLWLVDATALVPGQPVGDPSAVVARLAGFVRVARARGHWVAIGVHRPALADPGLRDLVHTAPLRFLASDLFHTRPARAGDGGKTGTVAGRPAAALDWLLDANSEALVRRIRSRLGSGGSVAGATSRAELLRIATELFEGGFLEPAYRLELYCRPRRGLTGSVPLAGDLSPIEDEPGPDEPGGGAPGGGEWAWSFEPGPIAARPEEPDADPALPGQERPVVAYIDPLTQAPRAGDRLVLTAKAGAGKTVALSQIESTWSIPRRPKSGKPAPAWVPVLIRLDSCSDGDPTAWLRGEFRGLCQLKIGPGSEDRVVLAAHEWLSRNAAVDNLEWHFSSPVLYLIDGWSQLPRPLQSAAGTWLDRLHTESPRSGMVLAARAGEEPSDRTWYKKWFEQGFQLEIRALSEAQVRTILGRLSRERSGAILELLGCLDGSVGESVRTPFFLNCLVETAGRAPGDPGVPPSLCRVLRDFIESRLAPLNDGALMLAEEALPDLAYAKVRNNGPPQIDPELLDWARGYELLGPGDPPRFTHQIFEDFFASRRMVADLAAGSPVSAVLPARLTKSDRRLESQWGLVFRFLLGSELDDSRRQELLAHLLNQSIGAAGTRPAELLTLRCARELPLEAARRLPAIEAAVQRTIGRIQARWEGAGTSTDGWLRLSVEDASALGSLDPRLRPRDLLEATLELPASSGLRCRIGRFPVTNLEFAEFLRDGYEAERYWHPEGWAYFREHGIRRPEFWSDPALNQPNAPVVGVSFHEALAYARWAADRSGSGWRGGLPTEPEWSAAAGIPGVWPEVAGRQDARQDRRDPDDPEEDEEDFLRLSVQMRIRQLIAVYRGSFRAPGPHPVGLFRPAETQVHDLFGNVWEWCDDWFARSGPGRPPSDPGQGSSFPVLVRGGPAPEPVEMRAVTSLVGSGLDPFSRLECVGFRLCLRPPVPEPDPSVEGPDRA